MTNDPTDTLLNILDLEPLDANLYRGTGAGGETSRRIYGGQVISQALAAAYRTVDGRGCHSLHAYFLRAGNPNQPVIYEVDRARDGGSFSSRRVVAIQNGKPILNLAASFHAEEPGPDHQRPMPQNMPDPDTLESRDARRERLAQQIDPARRADFLRPSPIEVREVDPRDPISPTVAPDENAVWFRLSRPVTGDQALHHCLLAYASDLYLLTSGLRPMGESYVTGRVMMASLDHAVWFHRPLNFSNWHLYVMEAPSLSGARGFSRGMIYDQSGALVASTTQEGMLRPRKGQV